MTDPEAASPSTEAGRREQADHMLAAIGADLDRLTLAQFADE